MTAPMEQASVQSEGIEAVPLRGRPRDADVDRKIIEAARRIYAERGWAGFNFGAVCKAAGVSKDAMYRRYSSREELLEVALHEDPIPVDFDDGAGEPARSRSKLKGRGAPSAPPTLSHLAPHRTPQRT